MTGLIVDWNSAAPEISSGRLDVGQRKRRAVGLTEPGIAGPAG
jgi:hypothetical protein